MNAFGFSQAPIDAAALAAPLARPAAGGFATFEGRVRDSNEGRRVTALDYEAFEALATAEGARIVEAALTRHGASAGFELLREHDLGIGCGCIEVGEPRLRGCIAIGDRRLAPLHVDARSGGDPSSTSLSRDLYLLTDEDAPVCHLPSARGAPAERHFDDRVARQDRRRRDRAPFRGGYPLMRGA